MKTTLAVLILCCSPILTHGQVNLDGPGQYSQWEKSATVETSQEARARSAFHRQVLKAIPAAVQAGTLSRRDAVRLRFSMLSPAFRSQCRQLATIQVLSSGDEIPTSVTDGAIEWDGSIWSEFFKLLLPLLIELLEEILAGLGGGA